MFATQGIKLDENIRNRLKLLGEKRDRSVHWLMRNAVETYLEREEQIERDKQEDKERWEEYQLTGKYLTNEQVIQWLDGLAQGNTLPCPK